ncbi:hypothetical protein SprV_0100474200 [Sparganum proliferum]
MVVVDRHAWKSPPVVEELAVRPVVNAGKGRGPFGCWIVDSIDRSEEFLPFVAVRTPLDLLGLAGRPGLLHLPPPLLHKAATTLKNSFVVVGEAVDLGFVRTVLLGEYGDGGVVVVQPVLVLAACAKEDSQGRRLDCVSTVDTTGSPRRRSRRRRWRLEG